MLKININLDIEPISQWFEIWFITKNVENDEKKDQVLKAEETFQRKVKRNYEYSLENLMGRISPSQ